jgi:hypothetical protein
MPTPRSRAYHLASALVFAAVALPQSYRAAARLPVDLGGFKVPVAFSWIVAVAAGALAGWGWRSRND